MNLSMNNISSNSIFQIASVFILSVLFYESIDIITERGCSDKFTIRKGDVSLECELTSPCSFSLPSAGK